MTKDCHPRATFSFVFGALGNRKILLIFIHIPVTSGMLTCVCVRGWIRSSSVCMRIRLCVYVEKQGECVSFTHRSVVARCERDGDSFRLSFSNRLDSTGHQAKGKLLYGASAFMSHRLVCSF